jgi:hypothetical protein
MKKSSFGNDVVSNIYSGAADFGRDYAFIVAAFVFVLCVVGVFVGVHLIRRKPVYTAEVDFLITRVTPETITETVNQGDKQVPRTRTIYNLEGTVQMCGNSKVTLPGYQTYVTVGQTVKAWMKPNCQSTEAHYSSDNTTLIGWIVIGVAIIVAILNALRLYFVKKYKAVAAVQGAAGASNLFKILK